MSDTESKVSDADSVVLDRGKIKQKVKKQKVLQKYLTEYEIKYPVVRKSNIGDTYAFCKLCQCDFSVGHSGLGDVTKHVKTAKHIARLSNNNDTGARKISNYFADGKDLSVIRAEVLFTEFIVEHNLPVACADHAGLLFRKMFPDSVIATKYGCGRTKTTHVLDTLAGEDAKTIVAALRKGPFSLATDGSNDLGSVKLYPVCVRYYDSEIGKVMCVLMSLRQCTEASTGENIFRILDDELTACNVQWQNCICFASDNASVMMGKTKGVSAFVTKSAPHVYILGCACHLIHLAASKASSVLTVKVDELLIDVYYYLDKSSNRMQKLEMFQKLHDIEVRKILKHVSTRWLSVGTCLSRLLEQLQALRDFFASEAKCNSGGPKTSAAAHISGKRGSKSASGFANHSSNCSSSKNSHSVSQRTTSTVATARTGNSNKGPDECKSHSSSKTNGSKNSADASHAGSVDKSKAVLISSASLGESKSHSSSHNKRSHSEVSTGSFDLTTFLWKEQKVASAAEAAKAKKKKTEESEKAVQKYSPLESRATRVARLLSDPLTELTCMFLQSSLPLFDNVNMLLQKDEPCIHLLHAALIQQFLNILVRFVKPAVISAASAPPAVQYKEPQNQKDNVDLTIGTAARDFISSHKEQLKNQLDNFYTEVRQFFITACDYMVGKFPYDDPVIINAQVADISKRQVLQFNQLRYFVDRFACLLPAECTKDQLEEEFLAYQITALPDAITTSERIDVAWHMISNIIDPLSGRKRFGNLSNVMKGILVMFHSNADCERIFSLVRKNKTDYRASLSTGTLGSLITRKTMMNATSKLCHTSEHNQQLLIKAKSATYQHHQQQLQAAVAMPSAAPVSSLH